MKRDLDFLARIQIWILFLLLLGNSAGSLHAQSTYWVYFTDKDGVEFDPVEYFHAEALHRRALSGDSILFDITDMPTRQDYVDSISQIVSSTGYSSRWINAVAVKANKKQLDKLRSLSFVEKIEPTRTRSFPASKGTPLSWLSPGDSALLVDQLESMGKSWFHEKGIDGKGIRVAVFDGGFPGVDTHPAFSEIRESGRIIATYDFTRKRENVYRSINHGTMVLSCIGGKMDNKQIGLATGSEFLLARTEVKAEPFAEEVYWMAAMEWADKHGARIINSSLGYTFHRYFTTDMDGKTSLVAKAAHIAARKGMLVVNAAGNEGSNRWQVINTPADADSVLAVGGIDPSTGLRTSFSSYGPTADQRRKPNVAAYGIVIAAGKKGLQKTQGTSFASPLVAGFAACAWQLNPGMNNMEIFDLIEKCGHLYPYYDYVHGHGMPHARVLLDSLLSRQTETFVFEEIGDTIYTRIVNPSINAVIPANNHYLYYHVEKNNGVLERYAVLHAREEIVLAIPTEMLSGNKTLRVHYKGFTNEYHLGR